MTQKRHVFSIACDDELIEDMDYYAKTHEYDINRSRAIEQLLRIIIPSRNLTTSKTRNK